MSQDAEKEMAAKEAVKLLRNGQIVGLGTGSTAIFAIKAIGELIKNGLRIQAVPTSNQTQMLAERLHIPLLDINLVESIDITIDGADEFTRDRMLIKGGGGALVREKIVAAMTKEEIIIADPSKQVEVLGKFKVPLAVVPFAASFVLRQLETIKGHGQLRRVSGEPFRTDEGNYIIDADFGLITDPEALSDRLNAVEGIVAHGLFLHLASKVIMGSGNSTVVF